MKSTKRKLLDAVFNWFGKTSHKRRQQLGHMLSVLSPLIMKRRAAIVRKNLALCFPDASPQQREQWQKQHFRVLAQSIIDRGLFWFGSPESILATIHMEGFEHIEQLLAEKRPILMLAPHFVPLDAAATRLSMSLKKAATIYTPQHDPEIDDIVREGRGRFNEIHLISRKEGVRGMLRHLKEGTPVYYLPDMDFGRKGSIFVPFFNIPAATLPTTAQIAKSWHAAVVPIVSRWDPATGHYHVQVLPALEDFPGEQSIEAATTRINHLLEQWILQEPSQYYWVHRRFKTRPEGEEKIY